MSWLPAIRTIFASSRRSPAEIRAFQIDRLRFLLDHARAEVPLYRRLYDGMSATALRIGSTAEMPRLPATDKALYQDCSEAHRLACSYHHQKLGVDLTTGSTGQPLDVRRTSYESRLLEAFRLRAFLGYGGRIRDHRVVVTWSASHAGWDYEPMPRPIWQRLGLLRRTAVDCRKRSEDLVRELWRLNPDVLAGYGNSLASVAACISPADRARIRPRFVMTGGESLTPEVRRSITKVLEVPVYDMYGAAEFNLIAWECQKSGLYHVCDDNVIVEILRGDDPAAVGEEGEVVVTGLHSLAMPFIRFRTGDVAVRGPDRCSCGASWSTLESLRGRTFETVHLPGGGHLHHWAAVSPLMRLAPFVRSYRLVQTRLDEIAFEVVVERPPLRHELEAIEAEAGNCFGDDVHFRLRVVAELPPGKAGKHVRFRGLES